MQRTGDICKTCLFPPSRTPLVKPSLSSASTALGLLASELPLTSKSEVNLTLILTQIRV